MVQIIIAEGCAHHRVLGRRFNSAFDGGQRRSAPGSSSGIRAVASWPGVVWAAGVACRLPASTATAAKPQLGSSRPPPASRSPHGGGVAGGHTGTAIWRAARPPRPAAVGLRMWLARSCFDSGACPRPQPPASPSLSPNVRPRPQGEASCSNEVENPLGRTDGEIRVSSKHRLKSSITSLGCLSATAMHHPISL